MGLCQFSLAGTKYTASNFKFILLKPIEHIKQAFDLERGLVLITCCPREHEMLELVVTGLLNKQIADKLGTCETTVKIHRGHVMRKMRVGSLRGLVRMAERFGMFST